MDKEKKDAQYFSDLNPLPVEESKKKKGFSGYSVEAAIIIFLALLVILFKVIFK